MIASSQGSTAAKTGIATLGTRTACAIDWFK